jgi:hypothetical protein
LVFIIEVFSGTELVGAFSTVPFMVSTLVPAFDTTLMVLVNGVGLPLVW